MFAAQVPTQRTVESGSNRTASSPGSPWPDCRLARRKIGAAAGSAASRPLSWD